MTFTFRPGLTVATLIALLILISLGTWQMQRLAWKRDLIASTEVLTQAAPVALEDFLARKTQPEYAPIRFRGRIDAARAAPVFGTLGPQPGVYLFVPVYDVSGQFLIYINLGFIPQRAFEAGDYTVPAGEALFTGLFRNAEPAGGIAGALRPDTNDDGFWYVRRPALFAASDNVDAVPSRLGVYVDRSEGSGEAWPRAGTTRLEFSNRHLEYALTWYGLALTLVGVFIAFSVRRGP